MLVPGVFETQQPGQSGIRTAVQDLIEFSPIGDVGDLRAGISGESDGFELDKWERGLAILGGIGLLGTAFNAKASIKNTAHNRQRAAYETQLQQQAAIQAQRTAASMAPPTGEAWDLTGEAPGLEMSLGESALERRRRAAKYAELTAAVDNDLFEILDLDSFETLAAVLDHNQRPAAGRAAKYIGYRLVELSPEGTFGGRNRLTGPLSDMEADIDAQALTASKLALTLVLNAAEQGKLNVDVGAGKVELWDVDQLKKRLSEYDTVTRQVMYLDSIIDLQMKFMDSQIGPDMVSTPQTAIKTMELNPNAGEGRLIMGAHVLPSARLYDPETTMMMDIEGYWERIAQIDWQTLEGDFAANIAAENIAQRMQDPVTFKKYIRWYRKANKSSKTIGRWLGRDPSTIAGVMSQMSPQNKWTPDNIVGSFHVTAYYSGKSPLDPEYAKVFREAMHWWKEDIYTYTGKANKKALGIPESRARLENATPEDVDAVMMFWADPENFRTRSTRTGFTRQGRSFSWAETMEMGRDKDFVRKGEDSRKKIPGDPNIQGMMDQTKWDGINMMLDAGLDPVMVLRHSKTADFYHAIKNPWAALAVAIDTHSDRTLMGNAFGLSPLASGGTRTLSKRRPDYVSDSGTGTVSLDMVEAARKDLIEAGFSAERAEKMVDRLKKVPADYNILRYAAARNAFALVARLFPKMRVPNQPQAGSWDMTRTRKDQIIGIVKAVKEGADRYQFALALKEANAVLDPSVIYHAEGVPQFLKGVVGMVANVSDDLKVPDPRDIDKYRGDAKSAHEPGEPIVYEQVGDGTAVWAVTTREDVRNVLRHLRPSQWRGGKTHKRWVNRAPRRVREVRKVAEELTSQTYRNRPVAGEARVWPSAGQPHWAASAGNTIAVEVDPQNVQKVLSAIEELEGAFEGQVVPHIAYERVGKDGEKTTGRRATIVFKLGDPESSLNWVVTDGLWKELNSIAEVESIAAHLHGDYWKPPGTTKVYEHLYDDGVSTMSWRTAQDVSYTDGHQFDVYVPNAEARNLSKSGNKRAAGTRSREDVVELLTYEGNSVWVNGDIEFRYVGDEYKLTKTGGLLRARIDGQVADVAIADVRGPIPVVHVGTASVLEPGLVMLDIDAGKVAHIEALDPTDLNKAVEALTSSGISFEGVTVELGTGEVGMDKVELKYDSTHLVTYTKEGKEMIRLDSHRRDIDTQTGDLAAQAAAIDRTGVPFKTFETSANMTDAHRKSIVEAITPFFGAKSGPKPILAFIKRFGPLSKGIMQRLNVYTGDIGHVFPGQASKMSSPEVMGITTLSDTSRPFIMIDEKHMISDSTPAGANVAMKGHHVEGVGTTRAQETMIHEFAHHLEYVLMTRIRFLVRGDGGRLTAGTPKTEWAQELIKERIRYAYERSGEFRNGKKISYYSLQDLHEFFAEAFTQVVVNPAEVDPEVHSLIADVWPMLDDSITTQSEFTTLVSTWPREVKPDTLLESKAMERFQR